MTAIEQRVAALEARERAVARALKLLRRLVDEPRTFRSVDRADLTIAIAEADADYSPPAPAAPEPERADARDYVDARGDETPCEVALVQYAQTRIGRTPIDIECAAFRAGHAAALAATAERREGAWDVAVMAHLTRSAQDIRLHAGELNAQEMRAVQAVLRWLRETLPPAAPPGLDEAALQEEIARVVLKRFWEDACPSEIAASVIDALRPLLAEREAEAWRSGAEAMREWYLQSDVHGPMPATPPPPTQGG